MISSLTSNVLMYRDDTKIYIEFESDEDIAKLQWDLVSILQWANNNGFSFNLNESAVIIYS